MMWIRPGRRLPLTLALLVGLVIVGIIFARTHGPKPDAGTTYTGTVFVETQAGKVTQQLPLSFAVSAAGVRVSAFHFPSGPPRQCAAATLGTATVATGGAAILNPSRFNLSLAITRGASRVGSLQISGLFHSVGRESGAMAAHYSAPGLSGCDANGGYTAKSAS